MENMQEFLDKLSLIEQKYNEKKGSKGINIFNVMYKGHEEVELHSRFISYLLSSNLIFLKLFVHEILKIEDFDLNNCEVYPNEQDKSEYKEIDILIINRLKKQAIIIENKIHANDSIHEKEEEHNGNSYKGQLERYYHTITTGYYKKGRDFIELEDMSFKSDKVYLYYLSLYKEPSKGTIGKLGVEIFNPKEHVIKYHKIQDWLRLCLGKTEDEFLKTIIQQYLNLIIKMINDDKIARELTNLIAIDNNWKSTMCLQNNFRHIKWHTIDRFWNELTENLEKSNYNITKSIGDNVIAEVAHKNKNIPISIEFENGDGTKFYIANDNKGFTLGNLTKGKWDYFSNKRLMEIKFFEFSNEETFKLLNKDNRDEVIKILISEIK